MTFDQLVTFVSMAKTKNFTTTAEALHLTQPSVTNRIKNLEEELGMLLVHRNNKSLELTRAGEKLLVYSNKIIDLMREAQLDIGKMSNEISIGTTPTLGIYNLPRFIQKLHEKDPHRNFIIKQGFSFNLLNMVISGNVDFALVLNRMEHPDVTIKPLKESLKVVLTGSPNHPIFHELHITKEQLKKCNVVKYYSKGTFWKQINEHMDEHNIQMNTLIQVDSVEIAKQLLSETNSLAFMPLQAVEKEIKEGTLKQIHIQGIPQFEFPIFLIYHKLLLHTATIDWLDIMEFETES